MRVRNAVQGDREWIVNQVEAFQAFMGGFIPFNRAHVEKLVEQFIKQHTVLVVDDDGELCGFAAATLQQHFLNPDIKAFVEIAWWVPDAHRHTRAGLLLLNALDKKAEELGAQLSVLAVEANSPLSGRSFIKRGYKPQELSLIKVI